MVLNGMIGFLTSLSFLELGLVIFSLIVIFLWLFLYIKEYSNFSIAGIFDKKEKKGESKKIKALKEYAKNVNSIENEMDRKPKLMVRSLSLFTKEFFGKWYDINYKFTFEELRKEIEDHNMAPELKQRVFDFLSKLGDKEFDPNLSEGEIVNLLNDAGHIADTIKEKHVHTNEKIQKKKSFSFMEWAKENNQLINGGIVGGLVVLGLLFFFIFPFGNLSYTPHFETTTSTLNTQSTATTVPSSSSTTLIASSTTTSTIVTQTTSSRSTTLINPPTTTSTRSSSTPTTLVTSSTTTTSVLPSTTTLKRTGRDDASTFDVMFWVLIFILFGVIGVGIYLLYKFFGEGLWYEGFSID